jgi:hypothetical protein
MAFPNDLSDVVVFKIHPAIGVARLSHNDDFYVFGKDPGTYKSNHVMKRQAVQFRIFAYGENHVGLGELTSAVMGKLGITAVWSARVGNRKIAHLKGLPPSSGNFVISAEASSDKDGGQLVGTLPGFAEGAAIPLGQITPTGIFIPPKTDAFRMVAGEELPIYPGSAQVADNSCDGSITVRLTTGGRNLDVLPACIVVCPQDFSPDTDEPSTLVDFLKGKLQIPPTAPPGNLYNQAARALDEAALASSTADFHPGVEMSLGEWTEVVDVKGICYSSDHDSRVDPREARVRYRPSLTDSGPGAVPGQLTSGLCSPWQSDYYACIGYWAEHLPEHAFLDENISIPVAVFRKQYADTSDQTTLRTADDIDRYIDKMGVVRTTMKIETERNPGDDVEPQVASAAPLITSPKPKRKPKPR